MIKIKVMKNGLGQWGIWWGLPTDEKCLNLAYKRFFKSKEVAEKWAKKFENKMMKK